MVVDFTNWLLTDRQTTVVLTIASLTVGTTWEQNQTRVNTPCTILHDDINSMQVTRQHMVARQHWNQINAWKIHKLITNENYQFKYQRKLKSIMVIIYDMMENYKHVYYKIYFERVKSLNQWMKSVVNVIVQCRVLILLHLSLRCVCVANW